MRDTWAAGPRRFKAPKPPRNLEWAWYAFVTLYIGVGIGIMWFIAQMLDGTL